MPILNLSDPCFGGSAIQHMASEKNKNNEVKLALRYDPTTGHLVSTAPVETAERCRNSPVETDHPRGVLSGDPVV